MRYEWVPALWVRFWTDDAYQARAMAAAVPRSRTTLEMWDHLLPWIARPIWD